MGQGKAESASEWDWEKFGNSEQGVRTEQVSKAPVAGDYPVWEVKPQ